MNYEELLLAKAGGKLNQSQMHIGEFFRAKLGDKYLSVVDIKKSLHNNIAFSEALKVECQENPMIADKHQLHFTPIEENGEIVRLSIVETGQYMSFAELLEEDPSIVARSNFLNDVLGGLARISSLLHKKGIRHFCFSPHTVFVRKGDCSPMLLSHGSYYLGINDLAEFYGDDAKYVAPEVLGHGSIDDRSDVYSIGKFLESLSLVAEMPIEYRRAIKKATSETPEDRYDTPDEMFKSVQKVHGYLKTTLTVAVSLVLALIFVGVFFEIYPETNPVEFVKPVPRQPTDDLLDDGFDPSELGVTNSGDSLIYDEASERDYNAKAEEIFRKKYTEEAERILSKIYNKEYMSNAEKQFVTQSQSTIDELMKKQSELGYDAGLTPERSQLIATEIIDRITEQKKKEMGNTNSRAIQK